MEQFGIGQGFIQWIKTIYSNATDMLNINGYLSDQIPLRRGVRQGCPLSALLYVLVIEVLAIQLRINPNIVGFTIEGEKIISTHYMDDATIIIKQNRCFKEVIKDLQDYEDASGAKVNYSKTKGLWVGNWKGRRVPPINIKWTSKNVKNLGIYVGNDHPDLETFNEIVPKFRKCLAYWKQFKISKIGKTRVVETFLASKLIYAMKFYPIPNVYQKNLQDIIFDFVNFPQKTVTIAQKEMWKTKKMGGIKLINLQIKSETSKVKWLIELLTDPKLNINLGIFAELLGKQIGNISVRNLLFLPQSYMQHQLSTKSLVYKEALTAISKFEIIKGIPNIDQWDNEHLFYNKIITDKNGNVLKMKKYFKDNNIHFQIKATVTRESKGVPNTTI